MCWPQEELAPAWRRPARESPVWELAWGLAWESEQVLPSEWRPVSPWQTEENLPQQPEVKTRRLTSLKTCLCTLYQTAPRQCKRPIPPQLGEVSCPRDPSSARFSYSPAVVNSSQPRMPRYFGSEVGPRGRPRFADERLANGGDRRDLVLHDLVRLRLRLARRDLLELDERVFEVVALAPLHRVLRVPEADGRHLVVFGQGSVPGNEPGLVAGSARHVLSQPGGLRIGIFA